MFPELEPDNIHETAAVDRRASSHDEIAVAELLKLGMKEEQIWISLRRKMCCRLGKCRHCRMNDTYIVWMSGQVICYSRRQKNCLIRENPVDINTKKLKNVFRAQGSVDLQPPECVFRGCCNADVSTAGGGYYENMETDNMEFILP